MESGKILLKFENPQTFQSDGRTSKIRFDFTAVNPWYLDTIKESKNTHYYSIYATIPNSTSHIIDNLIRGELSGILEGEVEPELVLRVRGKYLFHLFSNQISDMLDSGTLNADEITLDAPKTESQRDVAKRLIQNHELMYDPYNPKGVEVLWVPDVHEVCE